MSQQKILASFLFLIVGNDPDVNGACGLVTEGNFHPINGIDSWIASRRPAQRQNASIRDKAHMHEVVLHFSGQIQAFDDSLFPDA